MAIKTTCVFVCDVIMFYQLWTEIYVPDIVLNFLTHLASLRIVRLP